MKTIKLGSFEISSEKVIISDPSFDFNDMFVIENVRNGKWDGYVKQKDSNQAEERCAELHAYHMSSIAKTNELPEHVSWKRLPFCVDVDTGQAGIFDISVFRNDNLAEGKTDPSFDTGDPWYDMCSFITMHNLGGIVVGGVVSNAGFGDGSYEVFISKDGFEKIVAIKVVFIPSEIN